MSNNLTKVEYFEPNLDKSGKIKNFDGMSIGVALEIEVPSLSLTQKSTTYMFHTVKHRESVDFFKQNLGSAYEHIDEPMILEDYNMNEKIGLNNIRIEYNHWMYPTITMDIIDINGHGLNGMENINNYSDNNQIRKGHSLFESFFTMPYPLFKLTLKGYLGESITFNLTVETVKIQLNDSVGNFTLNVRFIGSKFGELTDIPMHFLILAPYLLGKKNDIGDLTHGGKMYTFKKLNDLLKKYTITAGDYLNSKDGQNLANQKNDLVYKKGSLQELLNFIEMLEKPLKSTSFVCGELKRIQPTYRGNSGDIILDSQFWKEETVENSKRKWIPYNVVGVNYNTEVVQGNTEIDYAKSDMDRYNIFKLQHSIKLKLDNFNKDVKEILGGEDRVGLIDNNDIVDFSNKWDKDNPDKRGISFVGYYYENNLATTFQKEIKKCDDQIKKIDESLGDGLSKLLTNSLGFPFSVGNFMEIICGHLNCFYDVMKKTCDKIKNQKSKRVYRDIKNVIINGKKSSVGDMTIPPFPLITNGSEELWFDEAQLGHFAERDLVVKTYDIIIEWGLEKIKESYTDAWQQKMSNIPSSGFFTLYSDLWEDYKYKRNNPYSGVKSLSEIANIFMKRCVLRLISCNTDEYSVEGNITDSLFGELEALTVLKSIANNDDLIRHMGSDKFYESDVQETIDRKWGNIKIEGAVSGSPVLSYIDYADGGWVGYSHSSSNDNPRVLPYDELTFSFDDKYFGNNTVLFNDKVYFEGEDIKVEDNFSPVADKLKKLGIETKDYEKILPIGDEYPWYEGWLNSESPHEVPEPTANNIDSEKHFGIYKVTHQNEPHAYKYTDFAHISKGKFGDFVEKIKKATDDDLDDFAFGEVFLNSQGTTDVEGKEVEIPKFLEYFCGYDATVYGRQTRIKFSNFLQNEYLSRIKKNQEEAIIIKFMESLAGPAFLSTYGDNPLGFKKVHPLLMAVHGARCQLYKQKYEEGYKKIVESNPITENDTTAAANKKKDKIKKELVDLMETLRNIIGLKYYQTYSQFGLRCIEYWEKIKKDLINKIKNFAAGDNASWILKNTHGRILRDIFSEEPIKVFTITNKTLRHDASCTGDTIMSELQYTRLNGYTDSCGLDAIGKFVETLKKFCKERSAELDKLSSEQNQILGDMNKNEIYKYIYKTYKQLYDRWKLGTKELNFNYGNMRIVNHFHEDISQQFMINITDFDIFKDITFEENDISVITYMNQRFSDFGFQSIILPSNIGNKNISTIFEVIPYNGFKLDDRPTYIAYHAQYESEKIYDNEYESNDGIDYTNFTVTKDGNSQIFGVTYGFDKQTIFNKIEVGSDKPKATAHSIKAQFNIAELGNPEASKTGMQFNNNLYPVYTNNSYECRVSMIGCAQMFPTLLFQLNNFPLFKGLYLITNVSHDIKGNVMTTSFSGTKVTYKRPKFVFQSGLKAVYSAPTDDSSDKSSVDISGDWKLASEADKQKAAAGSFGIIDLKNIPQGVSDEYTGGYTLEDTYIVINPGHGYTKTHNGKQSSLFEYGNASGVYKEYQDIDGNLSDVYQAIDQYTHESVVDEQHYKTRLREYWLNRKMSLALKEQLIILGVPEKHIVFEKNDVNDKKAKSAGSSDIMETYYSKKKKAIVISMHHNAIGSGGFNNTKYWCVFAQYPTYIHKKVGDYVEIKNPEASFKIAKSLIKAMQNSGIKELGKIESNPKVYTYKEKHSHPLSNVNNCPTIMIEGGFYTNLEMVQWYSKSTNRTRIAKVYAQGIVNFLNDN